MSALPTVDRPANLPQGLRELAWLVLPVLAAAWASWGVVMDPRHGTDLHGYQAVGRAVLGGEPFYTAAIPGQFLLSPVGALGTVLSVPFNDPVLHLGWGALCALAVLGLLRRAGVQGFALSLLAAIVVTVPPGRVAMTQGRLTWLIMLALVIDLVDWQRRPRWLPRGLLTGLATAVWPFTWPFLAVLLLRERRSGVLALGTLAAASLTAAAALPRMTLVFWTEVMPARLAVRESTLSSSNHSMLGAALRLFGPEARWPALALMIVAGAAAIAAAVWWDRLDRPWLAVTMATVGVLVASPLLPNPDLVWILLPVVAVTIARTSSGEVAAHDRRTPIGLSIVVMFALAWILADPLGALPRFKPVAEFDLVERLVTAGVPLLALGLAVIGLLDARAGLRTRGDPAPRLARFWHHRATMVTGSLVLAVGAAAWCAAITDADVHAFVGWDPAMADFEVYLRAARAFIAQEPLYVADEGQWPFLYPPFAALLAVPLGVLPRGLVQFGWLALTVGGLLALLHRLRLRGWHIAFATMVCIFIAGPIRSTIGLGQISVLLMVMCLLDIAPGRGLILSWLARFPALRARLAGRDRLLPAGVLIGIATAIKLTPGLFIPLLWFTGRRRAAVVATLTTGAACLLGFVVSPRQSWHYWTQVALGGLEFFPDPRGWMHNQSWASAWQRFVGLDPTLTRIGILIGVAFTLLGLLAAIRAVRRGHVLLGASLCGLAALSALPVAWNHYFVWALPLGVALLRPGVPRALRVVGLLATTWLITEPFWTVAYAGPDPLEFARWGLAEKLVGGAGALLTMAMTAVAAVIPPTERTSDGHARGSDLAQIPRD
ncbi:glycosyltransferase 87 family protein [Granulicoccus sp. GXG6511]|uniref:glycosyltransferase 87 family protein n=1 Tax=Granulicoccus sp. GXG6511 TaxID=3381351 RepID=UPI003D7C85B8